MRHQRTLRSIALLMITIALLPVARPGAAQSGRHCFTETGFCIEGRIREFWERNGGLPAFGFPIGPQREEQIEGRPFQIQWFERNRLELHPENARPYDVLLGRLGADRLNQQGRDWRAFPQSTPQNGCRFFAETGHNVCGRFLAAWRAGGLELDGRAGKTEAESLALFGLPLSDPLTETIEGREYTIQWFERTRFEDHGELGVLFGLLGREVGPAPPPPVANPPPPPPPVVNPPPPPDEVSERLRVPTGFVVRGFAAGLDTPRLMAVGPDGALYVAERGGGRVSRLPDADRDGRADRNETVLNGLNGPHSLEWMGGCLYVAENHQVGRHCDADRDGSLEQHTPIVELPTGGGHSSRTLHFGPDGKLYVSAGSTCNVCAEADPRRAAILRFNPDGSIPEDNPFVSDPNPRRRPVWAEGLRNSIDFVFMPDGQLWANHNGRDNMVNAQVKNDKPLEEIVIAVQGGRHHGWPYCTSERADGGAGPGPYAEVPDPSADVPPPPAGFRCADAVPALFTATAHTAPIGIAHYPPPGLARSFPADYQGDIFVALHGSWNRTPPAPCMVVRVQVVNGRPTATDDFLSGFQEQPGQSCGNAWGRPAGVIVGADGALYVSDDKNGRVYRIASQG